MSGLNQFLIFRYSYRTFRDFNFVYLYTPDAACAVNEFMSSCQD